MGIFDFFKKNKNIENDNGLNETYSNNGKGFLEKRYYKKSGQLDGICKIYTEFTDNEDCEFWIEEHWTNGKLEGGFEPFVSLKDDTLSWTDFDEEKNKYFDDDGGYVVDDETGDDDKAIHQISKVNGRPVHYKMGAYEFGSGNGLKRIYDENDNIKYELNIGSDGFREGICKKFNSDGKVIKEIEYSSIFIETSHIYKTKSDIKYFKKNFSKKLFEELTAKCTLKVSTVKCEDGVFRVRQKPLNGHYTRQFYFDLKLLHAGFNDFGEKLNSIDEIIKNFQSFDFHTGVVKVRFNTSPDVEPKSYITIINGYCFNILDYWWISRTSIYIKPYSGKHCGKTFINGILKKSKSVKNKSNEKNFKEINEIFGDIPNELKDELVDLKKGILPTKKSVKKKENKNRSKKSKYNNSKWWKDKFKEDDCLDYSHYYLRLVRRIFLDPDGTVRLFRADELEIGCGDDGSNFFPNLVIGHSKEDKEPHIIENCPAYFIGGVDDSVGTLGEGSLDEIIEILTQIETYDYEDILEGEKNDFYLFTKKKK